MFSSMLEEIEFLKKLEVMAREIQTSSREESTIDAAGRIIRECATRRTSHEATIRFAEAGIEPLSPAERIAHDQRVDDLILGEPTYIVSSVSYWNGPNGEKHLTVW